jgi:dTDP-glucose pyrophosphorylase
VIATRAVILARGLGTRMQSADPDARLTAEQARAADAGLKAMMPVGGRPFLDYGLGTVADAGLRHVALVVAPQHDEMRRHYEEVAPPSRLTIDFVVQPRPSGTADAVRAAESWAANEDFLVLNGDNLYPVEAIRALAALGGPGVGVFDPEDLTRSSGMAPARLGSLAILDVTPDGRLRRVDEKPSPELLARAGAHAGISLNAWRFDARIFGACRDVPRSERGELELPAAVNLAIARGVRFTAIPAHGPVLDLSRRSDLAFVATRLAGTVPHL